VTRSGEPRINGITTIFRGTNKGKEPVTPTIKGVTVDYFHIINFGDRRSSDRFWADE
jgi:hypothetical protein